MIKIKRYLVNCIHQAYHEFVFYQEMHQVLGGTIYDTDTERDYFKAVRRLNRYANLYNKIFGR